ncbi:hypothetical protein [Larkinella soli]|uniref:hypothetical protein n=1 Tax=Larkinella soli TaxID=1770527 RepID=UPI000FFB2470|nr:hypothetical protein [Larkinella soli]
MKFQLLVIADSLHYDYGLHSRQSYIDQFVRRLERCGQEVVVTYHAPLALGTVAEVLQQVPLGRYDLIILQVANRHLRHPRLPLRPTPTERLSEYVRLGALSITSFVGRVPALQEVQHHLAAIFRVLWRHRRKVILLTPFPHLEPVSGWLRKKGSALLREAGKRNGFRVFDTQWLVEPREEYFIPDDRERLNAVSHELIGRRLFDFYREEPTISTGRLTLDT